MTPSQPSQSDGFSVTRRRSHNMPAREVRERLDRLKDHGFIDGWHQEGQRWFVECPGAYRWYSRSEIGAWVDGANMMGAAP